MTYRQLPLYLAIILFGVAFSHSAVAQIVFDFPESKVPVLRVDEYYNEANKDRRPMLLVYSDGRVVRAVSELEADDYEFTLSESKFKKVLKQIFTDNDFATISDEKILEEISSRRKKRPSRSFFRVTTNTSEASHIVDFGNSWVHDRLRMGRKRHPKAEQLQRFLRVEDTCRELSNLALSGGEEAFQNLVTSANAKFKEAYPKGPEIGDSNLFNVRRNKDGEVVVRFRVGRKVVDPHPVSIWITITKDEDAKGEDAEEEQKLNIEVKVDKPILLRDVPTRPAAGA